MSYPPPRWDVSVDGPWRTYSDWRTLKRRDGRRLSRRDSRYPFFIAPLPPDGTPAVTDSLLATRYSYMERFPEAANRMMELETKGLNPISGRPTPWLWERLIRRWNREHPEPAQPIVDNRAAGIAPPLAPPVPDVPMGGQIIPYVPPAPPSAGGRRPRGPAGPLDPEDAEDWVPPAGSAARRPRNDPPDFRQQDLSPVMDVAEAMAHAVVNQGSGGQAAVVTRPSAGSNFFGDLSAGLMELFRPFPSRIPEVLSFGQTHLPPGVRVVERGNTMHGRSMASVPTDHASVADSRLAAERDEVDRGRVIFNPDADAAYAAERARLYGWGPYHESRAQMGIPC